jgi:two-component system cell cycle response regulator DivK
MEGYNAEFVTSGVEAVNKVRIHKPDLLLLDVMMPEISGLEVLQCIREDKDLQNLPVLLITAYKELVETDLTNTQANGIIKKPVDPDLLIEKVQAVFN